MFDLKKRFMKHVWRIQQIGALYSVSMLTVTISLLLYPFIEWRFLNFFEKVGIPKTWDFLIFALIFLMILTGALFVGFIYDRFFKLWKSQSEVAVERNPFTKNMMTPKEWINWQYYFIPMLRSTGNEKEADFMQRWNLRNLEENPNLKKEVEEIIGWVNEVKIPKEKWLKRVPDLKS